MEFEMNEKEIVQSYKESKDKSKQVEILADLNDCKIKDIIEILQKNGYYLHVIRGNDLDFCRKEIETHFRNGGSLSSLSRQYGCDNGRLKTMLNDMGIETPSKKGQKTNAEKKLFSEFREQVETGTYVEEERIDVDVVDLITEWNLDYNTGKIMEYISEFPKMSYTEKISNLEKMKKHIECEIKFLRDRNSGV